MSSGIVSTRCNFSSLNTSFYTRLQISRSLHQASQKIHTVAAIKQEKQTQANKSRKKQNSNKKNKTQTKYSEEDSADVKVVGKGAKKGTMQQFEDIGHIYDNPDVYDMAFQFRDIEAETDFLYDAAEVIMGRKPGSFLELGCGPAQHCMEMRDSGLAVYAIDSSQLMLEHAKRVAKQFDLPGINFIHDDMTKFSLPDDAKVDVIAILNNTICELVDMQDALLCLQSARDALAENGVIIIDMTHPGQYFDGQILSKSYQWNMNFEDGSQLDGAMASDTSSFDAVTQIVERTVKISLNRKGKLQKIDCKVAQRLYTYGEVELLADLAGLKVVDYYDEMSPEAVQQRYGQDQGDDSQNTGQSQEQEEEDDASGNENEEDEGLLRMVMILQRKTKNDKSFGQLSIS
eukprot:TRINITY_DN3245_c0_g3_i1.p1 TRINITY_DN3245_c0_g3~~TRINITY_DN3245_c0_g3_i1.p1  ORF type:complete len:402 (+),score=56.66 TRINITY_DN3245_c0_g3_i1:74-1279(+)